MLFRLNINQTEEDYFNFNRFHATETPQGKQSIKKAHTIFVLTIVVLSAMILSLQGWTLSSKLYCLAIGVWVIIYFATFKNTLDKNLRKQINRLKETGKLPFDPLSILEFHEDRLVEITDDTHTERRYASIERVCVYKDSYIFLYQSSMGAYVLPLPQVRAQVNQEDFLRFLSQKCNTVEYY